MKLRERVERRQTISLLVAGAVMLVPVIAGLWTQPWVVAGCFAAAAVLIGGTYFYFERIRNPFQ